MQPAFHSNEREYYCCHFKDEFVSGHVRFDWQDITLRCHDYCSHPHLSSTKDAQLCPNWNFLTPTADKKDCKLKINLHILQQAMVFIVSSLI